MSDKLMLHGTGRITKEPTTNENGSMFIDIVSNLYQKSEDPKNNTHPMWIRCIISGGSPLAKFLATKTGPFKGVEVTFGGEFNFRPFTRNDGKVEISYSIFPQIFQLHQTKTTAAEATAAKTADGTPASAPEDDLPF